VGGEIRFEGEQLAAWLWSWFGAHDDWLLLPLAALQVKEKGGTRAAKAPTAQEVQDFLLLLGHAIRTRTCGPNEAPTTKKPFPHNFTPLWSLDNVNIHYSAVQSQVMKAKNKEGSMEMRVPPKSKADQVMTPVEALGERAGLPCCFGNVAGILPGSASPGAASPAAAQAEVVVTELMTKAAAQGLPPQWYHPWRFMFSPPAYSPDMHKVIEHVHGTVVTAFRKQLREMVKPHTTIIQYCKMVEKLFYAITPQSVQDDIRSLEATWHEVIKCEGGYPSRKFR
jgi:hypothetical protein